MSRNSSVSVGGGGGVGIGAIIAAILSYKANASIGYAILHAFCSWFYVIYYLIYKMP